MDRRYGARINTDFKLTTYRDGHSIGCRAVDLSPTGALIRHRSIRSWPMVQRLELDLDGRKVQATARTVWCYGELQGVRFVGLSDVDRLEIAEHIDRAC
jgi:hypothetical protein